MDQSVRNLITLLQLFNGMPELLAQKLIQHKCLNLEFLKNISNNSYLDEFSNNPDTILNKPYFISLKEIHTYYDKFFINSNYEVKKLPQSHDPQAVLISQLEKAVHSENFELAAQIKKYMSLIGMDTFLKNN